MILFVTGSHGSGKSTAMRTLMKRLSKRHSQEWLSLRSPGRVRPLGYALGGFRVLGHYEPGTAGGMDTVHPLSYVRSLVETWALTGHVLFEGVSPGRLAEMARDLSVAHAFVAVVIETPVRECFSSIRARGHSMSLETVKRSHVKCAGLADKMETYGVNVIRTNRRGVNKILEEIVP